jgi:hypothetical protein
MNIAIFETEHFECAYPMIRILDMPQHHLFIFVNEATFTRFGELFKEEMKRYTWIVKPAGTGNRRFVITMYKACKRHKIDLLFLNTVSANFIFYGWLGASLPRTRVILTLHDANNFLRSRFSFNFRRLVRHIGKKILARYCYAYSTVSETVRHHLVNDWGINKPVFCIPGAVFEQPQKKASDLPLQGTIRIVVPGTIDERRRDYGQVFALLGELKRDTLKVTIVLLGGTYGEYGKSILAKCRQVTATDKELVYYDKTILEQSLFDEELEKCHFVWIPSVIDTVIADDIPETYGYTKSSGNIFDAIKHARPLLVPERLQVPASLETSVYKYSGIAELAAFLSKLSQHPEKYTDWAAKALENSRKYTVARMRERISDLI